MSNNITILQKYFNPTHFNVQETSPGLLLVYSNNNAANPCLELRIHRNFMKVEYVNKCNDRISGTQLLNIISNFAKDNGTITTIELQDTSKLPNLCYQYDFPLYILYILSTGKSWYNTYGYKSLNYEEEVSHNARLLNMPMDEFILQCNSLRFYPQDEEELREMMEEFYDVMNEHKFYKISKNRTKLNPQMTVKETFTRLKKYLLKNMPPMKKSNDDVNEFCYVLKWLMELVNTSNIILYDSSKLLLTVSRPYSGKTRSYKINSSRRRSTPITKTYKSKPIRNSQRIYSV